MWTADEIAQLCYEHYRIKLPKQGKPEPNREWTLLAAIVKIQSSPGKGCDTSDTPVQEKKEVVSIGTGTKCIGQSKMRKSGDILNDSHAEVIARRSFQRYLCHQLQLAATLKEDSIFVPGTQRGQWKLRPGIFFVFFSSHTPFFRCQNVSALPKGFGVQELKIQQSYLLFEQSRCAVKAKRADSPGRLVPCGAAISWSAVPEQPLDVTANGFPQGTTKKGIRSLQARSRISKVELFRSFQKLLNSIAEDEWPDSLRVQKLHTYQEYKNAASTYQEAWSALQKQAFGSWIRNPPDYHQFE
ncbi:tRNA-specific adenosine deaminase 1 [Octodon degus]|uniref:tRNA-specific adenosine deaminase 1 n=1 Tax=Octodon degus TaxID=10160 RepID=A0A6P6DYU6_OCTDE|nr:tRNA-specific adenosine deaminase 1 [Octodon degus]